MSSLGTVSISNDGVNSYFSRLLTPSVDPPLRWLQVKAGQTVRPYAAFGKWLRDRRLGAGYQSQPRAALRALHRGLTLINQGKISHIERGLNGDPDPELLQQLAQLYGLEYDAIVRQWMQAKYNVPGELTQSGGRVDEKRQTGKPETVASRQEKPAPIGATIATYRTNVRKRHATINLETEDPDVVSELAHTAINVLNAIARRGVASTSRRPAKAERPPSARTSAGRASVGGVKKDKKPATGER
jgi:hypothetical protein